MWNKKTFEIEVKNTQSVPSLYANAKSKFILVSQNYSFWNRVEEWIEEKDPELRFKIIEKTMSKSYTCTQYEPKDLTKEELSKKIDFQEIGVVDEELKYIKTEESFSKLKQLAEQEYPKMLNQVRDVVMATYGLGTRFSSSYIKANPVEVRKTFVDYFLKQSKKTMVLKIARFYENNLFKWSNAEMACLEVEDNKGYVLRFNKRVEDIVSTGNFFELEEYEMVSRKPGANGENLTFIKGEGRKREKINVSCSRHQIEASTYIEENAYFYLNKKKALKAREEMCKQLQKTLANTFDADIITE
ncbi:MAG: hypothetical protein CL760_05850 [Chloroflexi bacterium]|nr:hypothetical protein [Chloroflexota bacterium]